MDINGHFGGLQLKGRINFLYSPPAPKRIIKPPPLKKLPVFTYENTIQVTWKHALSHIIHQGK